MAPRFLHTLLPSALVILFLSLEHQFISDAEFLMTLMFSVAWYEAENPIPETYRPRPGKAFEDFTEHEFKCLFRFRKQDFPRLCELLHIPAFIVTKSRYHFDGRTALMVLLFRLCNLNKWALAVDHFIARNRRYLVSG